MQLLMKTRCDIELGDIRFGFDLGGINVGFIFAHEGLIVMCRFEIVRIGPHGQVYMARKVSDRKYWI